MDFRDEVETVAAEIRIAMELWDIWSTEFGAFFIAAPPTLATPLKVWSVGIVGGGCGSFYAAIGKNSALVGFIVNHEEQGDIGAKISRFKAAAVAAFGAHEVTTDDTIAAFPMIGDKYSRAQDAMEGTIDEILGEGPQ